MYVKKTCEINLHSHLKEIQHTSDSQSSPLTTLVLAILSRLHVLIWPPCGLSPVSVCPSCTVDPDLWYVLLPCGPLFMCPDFLPHFITLTIVGHYPLICALHVSCVT